MDEVAARAGVNKSLIYQYFGSKQELYAEALNHVLVTVTERTTARAREFLDRATLEPFSVALRILIADQVDMLETFPEFPRLLAWENLEGGRTLGRMQLQDTYQSFLQGLSRFMKPYQDTGVIAQNLNLSLVAQSIMALLHYFVIQKGTQQFLYEVDVSKPESREVWIDQVTAIIMPSLKGEKEPEATS
jgi:TetR/AcrR family transcriptional regulator